MNQQSANKSISQSDQNASDKTQFSLSPDDKLLSEDNQDIVERCTILGGSFNKEQHPEAVGGIDHYKTVFKVGDNWYEGVVNILNCRNVRVFYDVTKLRSIGGNELPVITNSPAPKTNASSNSIIPSSEENTNGNNLKYSISEIPLVEQCTIFGGSFNK